MYYYNGIWMNSDRDFIDAAYSLDKGFGQALSEYFPNYFSEENDSLWNDKLKQEEQIDEYKNLLILQVSCFLLLITKHDKESST